MGDLVTADAGEAEVLHVFFASVPVVEEDWVMDLLRNLNPYKSMGPEGKQPSVLADVVVISHTIIFERSMDMKRNIERSLII